MRKTKAESKSAVLEAMEENDDSRAREDTSVEARGEKDASLPHGITFLLHIIQFSVTTFKSELPPPTLVFSYFPAYFDSHAE